MWQVNQSQDHGRAKNWKENLGASADSGKQLRLHNTQLHQDLSKISINSSPSKVSRNKGRLIYSSSQTIQLDDGARTLS